MSIAPTTYAAFIAALSSHRVDLSTAQDLLALIQSERRVHLDALTRLDKSACENEEACTRLKSHVDALELYLCGLTDDDVESEGAALPTEDLNGVSPGHKAVSKPHGYIKPILAPPPKPAAAKAVPPVAASVKAAPKKAAPKKSIGALAMEVLLDNNRELTALDIASIIHQSNPVGHPHRTVQKWAKNVNTSLNKLLITEPKLARREASRSGGGSGGKKGVLWRGVRR